MLAELILRPDRNSQLQIEIELEEERPSSRSDHCEQVPVPDLLIRSRKEPELVQQAIVRNRSPRATDHGKHPERQVMWRYPIRTSLINERALYRSRDVDTLAAEQTGMRTRGERQAGDPEGNTQTGNPLGQPTAQLEGRAVIGKLPLPEYAENLSGKVVVRILVDNYGKVTSATPGIEGTTVQNRTLWNAARKAALEARFNVSGSAPALQEGKITYVFTLR